MEQDSGGLRQAAVSAGAVLEGSVPPAVNQQAVRGRGAATLSQALQVPFIYLLVFNGELLIICFFFVIYNKLIKQFLSFLNVMLILACLFLVPSPGDICSYANRTDACVFYVREAIALVKARLPAEEPILKELYTCWAAVLEKDGHFSAAAKW